MSIDQQRIAAIVATADVIGAQIPEEFRDSFKRDFVEVMTDLNEKIDTRLVAFVHDVIPLINLYVPHSPGDVQKLVSTYCSLIRQIAETAMSVTSGILNHAVRTVVMDTMQDTFEHCTAATSELAIRADERYRRRTEA